MRQTVLAALILIALSACRADESVRVYGGPDRIWLLRELNGSLFPARATLTFPKKGQIAGNGPCNRYFGAMKAPYPAFDAGPIGSTRMGCPDSEAETAFLMALEAATIAKVTKDTLVLSTAQGLEMVFKATD